MIRLGLRGTCTHSSFNIHFLPRHQHTHGHIGPMACHDAMRQLAARTTRATKPLTQDSAKFR